MLLFGVIRTFPLAGGGAGARSVHDWRMAWRVLFSRRSGTAHRGSDLVQHEHGAFTPAVPLGGGNVLTIPVLISARLFWKPISVRRRPFGFAHRCGHPDQPVGPLAIRSGRAGSRQIEVLAPRESWHAEGNSKILISPPPSDVRIPAASARRGIGRRSTAARPLPLPPQ